MISRKKAEERIKKSLELIARNKFLSKKAIELLSNKYNMPPSKVQEIINDYNGKINMLNNKTLYQVMDVINIVESGANQQSYSLDLFFTEKEMETYGNSKYEQEQTESIYPIEITNCIEVNPGEQWVTTMTAKNLSALNAASVINYNKNTQRNLTQKTIAGKVEYEITLKQKSVNEISKLMKENRFISNDITFNLNWEDPNLDFAYDKENHTIIINDGKLDIIDGYHRFRALMKNSIDETFDYNMVVNIVNFDEEKANRFIVQEDKRNKMNSNHIKSLDTSNPAHMIVKRLNEDSTSYICGQIGREDEEEKVPFNYLFNWIDNCFKIEERKDIIQLTKTLKNIFNSIIEAGIKTENLKFREVGIIIMAASLYPEFEAIEIAQEKLKDISKLDNKNFGRRIVNKRTIGIIETFVKERSLW